MKEFKLPDFVGLVMIVVTGLVLGVAVTATFVRFGKEAGLIATVFTVAWIIILASKEESGVNHEKVTLVAGYLFGIAVGYPIALRLPLGRQS